jgi:hypothetical protein
MRTNKLLAAAALAIAASGAQAATNLVINGSFEAETQGSGTYSIPTNLTGWTGGVYGIELRNNVAGAAIDGNNYVELDTTANSSMSQTITGNGLYQLSFWYSARPSLEANNSNGLHYNFGGLNGDVLLTTSAVGSGNNWQQFTGLVNLNGPTVLQFSAVESSNSFGGSLDNVSVTAVPEPETYALLLAGLGLMGTIARRRKNSPV